MANIYNKNSADARAAKSFLHDLTCIAGLRGTNQRTNGSLDISSYYANDALEMCNEVLNRNFSDVDKAIKNLSGVTVRADLTKARAKQKSWYSDEIATALVYLAECLNLYWDDLTATQYEVDTFKNTILGAKVAAYGRFLSDLQNAVASAPTSNVPTTRTASNRTPGQPPKNGYKSSGPQSGNIRDLHGTPGNKVYAQSSEVYCIIGTIANSKNVASAFIRPLSSSGAAGTTNAVFVNSGNGYTDCICWFDDITEARNFLAKVINGTTIKSTISNLQIARKKPDSNGYFLVGTEYGECAISAKKLNEALKDFDADTEYLEEDDNGWERVGARITNEEFETLTQDMMKY